MIPKKIFTMICTLCAAAAMFSGGLSAHAEDVLGDALNDGDWNAFVEEKIDLDSTPGMALTVVSDGEIGSKSWGNADVSANIPVTEDTVFEIGSCSKAFTGLTIFLLQEEGKLSIDDSVSDYLPWWRVTWKGAEQDTKIWQLMNHTSGIPNSTMMRCPIGDDDSLKEQTARIAENLALAHEPGTTFEYCNLGYDILAYIVETVSGVPFEEYVQTEIFEPMGMTHSGFEQPTAQGYRWLYGALRKYDEPMFKGSYGSGGVRSTARDMACWVEAQLGNDKLPEKLRDAIDASQDIPDEYMSKLGEDMYYFGGWIYYEGYRYHTGTNPAFSSYILIDDQRDTGIFSTSNAWINTPEYAAVSLYQTIKGDEIDRERLNVTDTIALIDYISTRITISAAMIILFLLIRTVDRKGRMAKKPPVYKKEKRKCIIRCALLIPLFIITLALPEYIVMKTGYGVVSVKMMGVWLPYSFIIGFALTDAAVLFAIVSSIMRFKTAKQFFDK